MITLDSGFVGSPENWAWNETNRTTEENQSNNNKSTSETFESTITIKDSIEQLLSTATSSNNNKNKSEKSHNIINSINVIKPLSTSSSDSSVEFNAETAAAKLAPRVTQRFTELSQQQSVQEIRKKQVSKSKVKGHLPIFDPKGTFVDVECLEVVNYYDDHHMNGQGCRRRRRGGGGKKNSVDDKTSRKKRWQKSSAVDETDDITDGICGLDAAAVAGCIDDEISERLVDAADNWTTTHNKSKKVHFEDDLQFADDAEEVEEPPERQDNDVEVRENEHSQVMDDRHMYMQSFVIVNKEKLDVIVPPLAQHNTKKKKKKDKRLIL